MGRVSLEESWQSARSEIKALHHEIATLKSKFSELEHEHYTGMSQQVSSSTIIIISYFVLIGMKCIKLLLHPVKALKTTISSVHPFEHVIECSNIPKENVGGWFWVNSGGVNSCKDVALSFPKNAKKSFCLILNLFEFDWCCDQMEKPKKLRNLSASGGWTSGWRILSSHIKAAPVASNTTRKQGSGHPSRDDYSSAPTFVASTFTGHNSSATTTTTTAIERRRSHSIASTVSAKGWRNSIS